MKTRKIASLWFLILMVGLDGCGSPGSRSTGPPPSGPPPSISISPAIAGAGSPDLTLTVTALGAVSFFGSPHKKSDVVWSVNGSDTLLATTFVSSTELTAVIPADLLASPVIANVAVETGDPMGSAPPSKSASATFTVTTASSGQLLINSISPTSAAVGSSNVTLTISGSGFTANCGGCRTSVVWNNQTSLTITSASDTELIVVIPAALLTIPVTAEISIQIWFHADSFPRAVSNSVAFNVTGP